MWFYVLFYKWYKCATYCHCWVQGILLKIISVFQTLGQPFFALVGFLYHCCYYCLCCVFHKSIGAPLISCSCILYSFMLTMTLSCWLYQFPLAVKPPIIHFEFRLIALVKKQLFPNIFGCPIWGIDYIFDYTFHEIFFQIYSFILSPPLIWNLLSLF